jgi:hypothetical protein
MHPPGVTNYQRLYCNTLFAMDVLLLVGIPLALGILTNFVVAIIALVMASVVIYVRKRFLDDKAKDIILDAMPRPTTDQIEDGTTTGLRTSGGPTAIMALAASVITVSVVIPLAVRAASEEAILIWPIICIGLIWFGVAMTAVGRWLGGNRND